jgi:hypothetical protein
MDVEKTLKQYQREIFAVGSLAAFAILPLLKKPSGEVESRKRKDRFLVFSIISFMIYRDAMEKGKRLKSYRDCVKTENAAICASRFIGQSIEL